MTSVTTPVDANKGVSVTCLYFVINVVSIKQRNKENNVVHRKPIYPANRRTIQYVRRKNQFIIRPGGPYNMYAVGTQDKISVRRSKLTNQ